MRRLPAPPRHRTLPLHLRRPIRLLPPRERPCAASLRPGAPTPAHPLARAGLPRPLVQATIRKRFRTYLDESMPVVEALEARGLVRRVSAEGSADAVFAAVLDAFADQRLGATRATG
mmetsp:Transcript_7912/g.26128  ORF Transcript_7912/g.26128 Transcript_7912/m.26128 type:complete len:117 (-) Transcript_7912:136-486(-)